MDIGTLRGIITLVLMLMFVGIWLWAWSGKRRTSFQQAAQLPLDDDTPGLALAKETGTEAAQHD